MSGRATRWLTPYLLLLPAAVQLDAAAVQHELMRPSYCWRRPSA